MVVLGPTEDAFRRTSHTCARDRSAGAAPRLPTGRHWLAHRLHAARLRGRGPDARRRSPGVTAGAAPRPLVGRGRVRGVVGVADEAPADARPSPTRPTPAQLADGETEAKAALRRELGRQKSERLAWVTKARNQLNDLEDRFLEEIAELPKDRPPAAYRELPGAQGRSARPARRDRGRAPHCGAPRRLGARRGGRPRSRTSVMTLTPRRQPSPRSWPSSPRSGLLSTIVKLPGLATTCSPATRAPASSDASRSRDTPASLARLAGAERVGAGAPAGHRLLALCRRPSAAPRPTVRVRTQDPASVYGTGAGRIQRFQIKVSQLKEQAEQT